MFALTVYVNIYTSYTAQFLQWNLCTLINCNCSLRIIFWFILTPHRQAVIPLPQLTKLSLIQSTPWPSFLRHRLPTWFPWAFLSRASPRLYPVPLTSASNRVVAPHFSRSCSAVDWLAESVTNPSPASPSDLLFMASDMCVAKTVLYWWFQATWLPRFVFDIPLTVRARGLFLGSNSDSLMRACNSVTLCFVINGRGIYTFGQVRVLCGVETLLVFAKLAAVSFGRWCCVFLTTNSWTYSLDMIRNCCILHTTQTPIPVHINPC